MQNPEYTASRINAALAARDPRVSVAWSYGVDGGSDPVGFDVFLEDDETPFTVEDRGGRLIIEEAGINGFLAAYSPYDKVAKALIEFIQSWTKEKGI